MYVEYKKEVDKLIAANFTREQAEAIMQQIENQQRRSIEELATTNQLQGVRNELKQDIAGLRSELKQDIASLRNELKLDITNLRNELKQDLTKEISAMTIEIVKLQQKVEHKLHLMLISMVILVLSAPYVPSIVRYIFALLR